MKRLHHLLPTSPTPPVVTVVIILLLCFCTSCGGSSETAAAQSSNTGNDAVPTGTLQPAAPTATGAVAQPETAATATPQSANVPAPTVTALISTTLNTAGETVASPAVDTQLPLSRTLNVLILGSDRRPNTPNWRTDVMMIVALDFDQQRIGVISIPRDVYLDVIPNHQPNRINVVDYLGERDHPDGGGPELMKQIIRTRMGILIHHYLRFDFNSFRAVVNSLGGVEIDIDCRYVDSVINLQPGVQRLTGDQALRYVRSRDIGGDLDRARRQQRFVWAVRNQVLKENLLPRVPALYQALAGSVQTDIGIVTALRLVRFALAIDPDHVHSFVIAPPQLVTEGWRQGMFVFVPDWSAITAAAQQIFDRPPFVETNTPARCP
ncbi:MAG: LCP family protein [Caldilineaceae bacterium]